MFGDWYKDIGGDIVVFGVWLLDEYFIVDDFFGLGCDNGLEFDLKFFVFECFFEIGFQFVVFVDFGFYFIGKGQGVVLVVFFGFVKGNIGFMYQIVECVLRLMYVGIVNCCFNCEILVVNLKWFVGDFYQFFGKDGCGLF